MNPNFEKGSFRGTKIPPYLVFTVGDFGCVGGNSSQLPSFARGDPFIRTYSNQPQCFRGETLVAGRILFTRGTCSFVRHKINNIDMFIVASHL